MSRFLKAFIATVPYKALLSTPTCHKQHFHTPSPQSSRHCVIPPQSSDSHQNRLRWESPHSARFVFTETSLFKRRLGMTLPADPVFMHCAPDTTLTAQRAGPATCWTTMRATLFGYTEFKAKLSNYALGKWIFDGRSLARE